jgi:hypothetical protein
MYFETLEWDCKEGFIERLFFRNHIVYIDFLKRLITIKAKWF